MLTKNESKRDDKLGPIISAATLSAELQDSF